MLVLTIVGDRKMVDLVDVSVHCYQNLQSNPSQTKALLTAAASRGTVGLVDGREGS